MAGNFIIAIGCGTLGFSSWGILFFGTGVLSWFALESIIMHRLFHASPLAASYWAFSFGITALSGDALQMTSRGLTGAIADMAPAVFVFTQVVMAALIVGTIVRAAQNKLLPPAPVVAVPAG